MASKAPVLSCPEVMSAEDVANVLRIPVKTVRARLHDGSIKGTKIGKHWRITKESLERFLK